jgi:2-polyprenyl-6-methoxyphenol hydroxylase-like FAD-dependent oxidoreductase
MNSNHPRIAIIGGGIGGLAAAAFLHRAGLSATVYEQAAELKEVGAGLVVAPNAARLIRRLGVMDQFEQSAVRMDTGWEFRRWEDGTVISVEMLDGACERLYGEHTYAIHRANLLDVIRTAVPTGDVQLDSRCVSVTPDDEGVRLLFADGRTAQADIVIGADGVHSVVRGVVTQPTPPEYSGICAFRALVPAAEAPEFSRRRAHTLWVGPGHHLVHYPIAAGRYVNLVAFAPANDYTEESWSATATREELLAEFDGWDSRLVDLISAAGTPGRWELLDRAPLKRWSSGSVTLLGDAAHPMFPFFAQGAAQAIEDSAVLATCLAADTGNPEVALKRYESARIGRTTRLQEASHARAHINHLPDGPEQQARDASLGEADPLVQNDWIYGYDAEAAVLEEVAQ